MVQKTSKARAGDFLIHMESPQKCLSFGQLTAPASGGDFAIDDVVAYPLLASNVLAKSGDEASIVAFVIAGDPVVDLGNDESTDGPLYTIINNFDGVVLNEDMLPTTDAAATPGSFNKTNIKAALTTLGAKWVSEPDLQTVQND